MKDLEHEIHFIHMEGKKSKDLLLSLVYEGMVIWAKPNPYLEANV